MVQPPIPAASYDDVWVVVPCYNEAAVVGDVVAGLRAVFPHVVGVDDGSSDGSATLLHRAGAHVVRHPVNLGAGAAMQTGVEYARAQPGAAIFVMFDADGQHQVADAVAMVDRLRTEPFDVLLGTRFANGGDPHGHVPWAKRWVLRTVARLSTTSRLLGLTDAHNGLRVFNRTVADALDLRRAGMAHASEFVDLIAARGWRVGEHGVDILYTDYSRAKGQPLINGVNIVFDNLLGRRARP